MSRTKLTQNSIAAGAINANTMFAADVVGPHAIANTSTYSVGELLVGGTILLDNTGVITGPSSITSTAFVGTLSTAAQSNITSLGTLTALTVSGDISGGTINATGDTAADDNAAIGYTSAEGLILTGQGSTSDITLKNDADAIVFTVPTGTDDILFPDSAKAIFGAGSDGSIYSDGTNFTFVSTAERHYTDAFQVSNAGASETILTGAVNGAVTLYYDNAVKLATISTGISVTGNVDLNDSRLFIGGISDVNNNGIRLGDSTTSRYTTLSQLSDGGFYLGQYTGSTWAERFRITPAGLVGIGTTAPASTLHVTGAGVPGTITSTDNAFVLALKYSSSTAYIGTNGNALILAPSTGAIGATLNATGFGIGLTPTKPFQVYANGGIQFAVHQDISSPSGHFMMEGGGGASYLYSQGATNTSAYYSVEGTGSHLWFGVSNTGTQRMALTPTGLGIGTSSPSSPLTVYTSAGPATQITQTTAGENAIRVIGSHASFTGNVLQPWTVRDSGSEYDLIECVTNNGSQVPWRVRGDGYTTIKSYSSSLPASLAFVNEVGTSAVISQGPASSNALIFNENGSERMRITAGGSVGIGTTAPTGALHVVGTVVGADMIMQFPPTYPASGTSTTYQNGALTSADSSLVNSRVPCALKVTKMYLYVNGTLSTGSAVVTLMKDGSAQSGTIAVDTSGGAFDSTPNISFTVGQRIGIKVATSSTSAAWYHVTLLCERLA